MGKSRHIITICLALTLFIGTLNSIYKTQKLPSFRFFFGSGVLWILLNFLAEFEDEIAKNIALAISVFVILGEGGGVLDHFLGSGTSNTTLNTQPQSQNSNSGKHPTGTPSPGSPVVVMAPRRQGGVNAAKAPIQYAPIKPVLPHTVPVYGFTG